MAELLQCDNCGAVLGDEDLFCGECGAPRPASVPPPEPATTPPAPALSPEPVRAIPAPAPAATPPSKPVRPAAPSPGRRQIAVIVAGLLAAVALALLILGLVVAFLLPQSDVGQAGTPDMILGATILCFCPGVMALTAALALWLVLIRRR